MATDESSAVVGQFRALFNAGTFGPASDAQLLERYRSHRHGPEGEAAFAVLVARHGPMVLGVCRRALRDPNDAADAFQATFLILVRKAGSVRVDDSLGRWLYGVSRRVAARARADSVRRSLREAGEMGPEPPAPSGDDADRRELLEAIDAEIARLPEPFRAVMILCDLGGLPHEDAARQLGCAVGTVESRLSRARRRLRERLNRRGFGLLTTLPAELAPRTMPESLTQSTVELAARTAVVPAAVSQLIQGAMKDMALTRMKVLASAAGLLALAGVIAIAAADPPQAERPLPKQATRSAETKATESPLPPPARIKPGDVIPVEVLEALPGRPISGLRLVRPDGTISMGFYGDVMVAGLNRHEIKEKIILLLRKMIPDEVLGLVAVDDKGTEDTSDDVMKSVDPKESDRVFVDDSPTYDVRQLGLAPALDSPVVVRPGDHLMIIADHALRGHPISGIRVVRADGTISLGFYGDLAVAGSNRREIKLKLIDHLRKYLSDEDLGLATNDVLTGKKIEIAPGESTEVLVELILDVNNRPARGQRLDGSEEKLDQSLRAIPTLKPSGQGDGPRDPALTRSLADYDRRLSAIESKLEQLTRAVEGLKGQGKR